MRTSSSVAFLFGILALVANCQEGDEPPMPTEDELPMDAHMTHDAEKMTAIHNAMDANKDGKVSKAEMHAFTREAQMTESRVGLDDYFKETDKDSDGKVSLEEYTQDMMEAEPPSDGEEPQEAAEREAEHKSYVEFEKEKFKVADRNKDGFLNADEMHVLMSYHLHDDMLTLVAQHTIKNRDEDKNGELSFNEFWSLSGEEDAEAEKSMKEDFAKIDKDQSGTININEFKDYESGAHHADITVQRFLELADKDNDGHISADEFSGGSSLHADDEFTYHLHQWAQHSGHGGEL